MEDEIQIQDELAMHVQKTYQTCWEEFYKWESGYCLDVLKPLWDNSQDLFETSSIWQDANLDDDDDSNDIKDTKTAMFQNIKTGATKEMSVPVTRLSILNTFPPVPPYQFCMWIPRSVPAYIEHEHEYQRGGRPVRDLWLYFCPFTDVDESFSGVKRRQLLEVSRLDWEFPKIRDPDLDVIQMETICRLLKQPKVTDLVIQLSQQEGRNESIEYSTILEIVEDLEVLPHNIFHRNGKGLPYQWQFRVPLELPHWNPAAEVPLHQMTMASPIDGQRDAVFSWCPICREPECSSHPGEHRPQGSLRRAIFLPPTIPEVDKHCNETDCMFYEGGKEPEDWSHADWTLLGSALVDLRLLEWASPCKIAAIIGKPCRETYSAMKLLQERYHQGGVNDNDPHHSTDPDQPTEDYNTRNISDTIDITKWKFHEACSHPGSCTKNTCSCKRANSVCRADCRCSPACRRRQQGCDCHTSSQRSGSSISRTESLCSGSRCSCFKKGRECDPLLCQSCRTAAAETTCTNNMIQRQQRRKTIVKRAEFGWGLFAAEDILANEFIMDYVGEIVSGLQGGNVGSARDIIAKHLGRSYTYGLSDHVDIDAACAGNASRLINDPQPDDYRSNTYAKHIWSSGEPHMAIFAQRDINDGEELLLSYGDDFWNSFRN